MAPLAIVLLVFVTVIGAVVGSFLNVCIYRLPFEKSIVWPASHCPKCLHAIRWHDNVPVLSWFLLGGRCRDCGASFSPRYMLIEAATAALFGVLFWIEAPAAASDCWRFALHAVLVATLIVATFIDLDLQVIPDSVTVPGMLIGLVAGFALPELYVLLGIDMNLIDPAPDPVGVPQGDAVIYWLMVGAGWTLLLIGVVWQWRRPDGPVGSADIVLLAVAAVYLAAQTAVLCGWPSDRPWPGWPNWFVQHPHGCGLGTGVIGLLTGAGLVWFVRVVGTAALGKEAMGFGDVTLMAMIGAFVGWQAVSIVFFLAPFLGLVVGVTQWITRGNKVLPYGPYLSIAALAVLFLWPPIWGVAGPRFLALQFVPAPLAVGILLPILVISLIKNWRTALRDARVAALDPDARPQ